MIFFVRSFLLGFLIQSTLVGCIYNFHEGPLDEDIRPTPDLINKVSFQDISKIFRAHCTGCHGTSGGVNLETHAGAKLNLERIRRSTIIERRMPKSPYPSLDREQLTLLAAWIEAGGPEQSIDGERPAEEPDVLLPTFESINTFVLKAKCVVCHTPGKSAGNIPLLTKSDLLDSPYDLVVPGEADSSGLILVLKINARKKMPPESSGIDAVTPDQITVIKQWINNGGQD